MLPGFDAYRDNIKMIEMEADQTLMRVYLNTGETDVTYTYFGDFAKDTTVTFKVTYGLGADEKNSTKVLKN
jgi:hypothetical protein